MKKNTLSLVGLIALLAMLLSACSGAQAPAIIVEDAQVGDSADITQDPGPIAEDAGDPEVGENEPEPEVRVPRPNLEATDPASVVLAAGQPQLVEFFAFW